MNNYRPPRRFSTIIVSVFSLFIVAMLVVMSIISYYYSYDNMRARTIADTDVILTQSGKNIGRYITNIEGISGLINANADLQQYLSGEYANEQEANRRKAGYEDFLDYIPKLADGIESVFIFDKENKVIYKPGQLTIKEGYDITQEEWYQKVEGDTVADPALTSTQVRMMTQRDNPWVISLSSRIVDGDGTVLGTQLIELGYGVIDEIVNDINLGSRGYVFIVDAEGNIVYHPQLQLIYSGLKSEQIHAILASESSVLELRDENKMYNIVTAPGTDFSIVGVTYLDEIVTRASEMIMIYVLIVLIMALAAFIGSVQMAKYITKPLFELESAVNQVEQGNLDVKFDIKGTLETQMFATSLGAMVSTVKQLMEQVVEDQEVIRTSELRALQSQINPHFLYNTLDSIVWIAEEAGNEKIKDITMALANYFRIVLSSGKDIISAREEVEHVRNYLVIQKMRYDTLDYEIQVEEEVLEYSMPKLLLQPIVENAIYHGIKNNEGGGTIWVRGYIRDNKVIFEVEDDGRGMRPQELRTIFKGPKRQKLKHGGVGMRNIRERIELYYGNEFGVQVESVYRKGTKVTVTLPMQNAREE